jgi:adenylate cyclase
MVYFRSYDQRWAGSIRMSADDAFGKARDHLKLAQSHPTSLSHQVAGNISRERGWYDDALKEFAAAIALDPSDSWSYVDLAYTLIWAGRPAEAEAQIETAMRLDPHYPPIFVFYQGLAQFAQDRFAEAAKTFEEVIRLNPDAPWVGLYLAAAYGKDGRNKEAAASVATYSGARVRQGGMPFVMAELQGNSARTDYKFPEKSRLIGGIRIAGVPFNFDTNVYDGQKLSGPEIDTLVFGHRLHGRTLESGEEHGASISADGVAQTFGDWGSGTGIARLDGNELCIDLSSTSRCLSFFRNPGGTRAKENEYIWFGSPWAFPFSRVD